MGRLLGSWLFVNAAALLVGVGYFALVRQPAKLEGDQLLTTPLFAAAGTWLTLALLRNVIAHRHRGWRE